MTPQYADLLSTVVAPADMSRIAAVRLSEVRERGNLLRSIRDEAEALRRSPKGLHELAQEFSWITKPYAHQIHATLCAMAEPFWGLWMGTGTGKTKAALDAFRLLREIGEVDRLLVVAPSHLVERSWSRQVRQHTKLRPTLLLGSVKQRIADFSASTDPVVVTGYSTFSRAVSEDEPNHKPFVEALSGPESWMVLYDEAHRIGSPTSGVTKAAKALCWAADRALFLTATPMTGKLKRLFHMLMALNQGASFGSSWARFTELADKFGLTYDAWGKPRWKQATDFMNYVQSGFTNTGTQWVLDDCVDLPKRIFRDIRLDLTKDQRRIDKALIGGRSTTQDGVETYVADDTGSTIFARALLASGIWRDADGERHQLPTSPKRTALLDLLNDDLNGLKVIVWCRFHAELDMLHEVLTKAKIQHAEYSGRVAHKRRDRAVVEFRSFGGVDVLLATPASFGEGHTLNEADAQVFFSLGYDWKDYQQALGRNYRIGQSRRTLVYRLICRESIDVAISANLRGKKRLRDMTQ